LTKKAQREIEKRERAARKVRDTAALFMRRSYGMFKNTEKRFGVKLPFGMQSFREWIQRDIGKPCRYCHAMVTVKTFSADHEQPISRGGELLLSNITVICLSCNKAKGNMTGPEFRRFMEFLQSFEQSVRVDIYGRLKAGGAIKGKWAKFARHA
jgi:5-methylcytosine-specific restriction endonuclease McrA